MSFRRPALVTSSAGCFAASSALAFATAVLLASAPARAAGPAEQRAEFLAGWQAAARPLFLGEMRTDGRTWRVPENLDRGAWRVIWRDAQGQPHLVPGQRFVIGGATGTRLVLPLPDDVVSPEALPESFVRVDPTAPAAR